MVTHVRYGKSHIRTTSFSGDSRTSIERILSCVKEMTSQTNRATAPEELRRKRKTVSGHW